MREQEMRARALRFLKVRMRNMIMPATVGIGLAVGACSEAKSLYMGPMPNDAGRDTVVLRQDTQAGPDLPSSSDALALPDLSAPDLAPAGRDSQASADLIVDTFAAIDAGTMGDTLAGEAGLPDVGGMKYIAPFADAAQDAGAPELGGMKYIAPFIDASPGDVPADTAVAKYVAPMPDADTSDKPAMRYMAQMPDLGGAAGMYMAQFSS